jgi:hypothetical protein
MKNAILAVSLITSFAIAAIQAAYAEEGGRFSLETGVHYNTGKYGSTQATDILYIPFTGKYQDKSWTIKVTVPYLQVTGPSNVINGVGLTGTATSNIRSARSGLGDVIASASHSVYNDGPSGLMVYLTGKVKLGTASSSQGLGTGKNDYALQSDVYQVTGRLTTFGTLGYQVYGRPAGYTLNNAFYGWLGGSYKFNPENSGGVMFSFGQKITTTGSSRSEALIFANHKIEKNWKAQGYVLKGFTNSVPDFGAGATVAYDF